MILYAFRQFLAHIPSNHIQQYMCTYTRTRLGLRLCWNSLYAGLFIDAVVRFRYCAFRPWRIHVNESSTQFRVDLRAELSREQWRELGAQSGSDVCPCMYVCMHVCMYIHTYIHTCRHTYIHTCIHTYLHSFSFEFLYFVYTHNIYRQMYQIINVSECSTLRSRL